MKQPGKSLGEGKRFVQRYFSRRSFLKGSGALVAGSTGTVLVSCGTDDPEPQVLPDQTEVYDDVAPPPPVVRTNILRFFTMHEAETVDAITSRIIPGDADDPGAHEAGIVTFIDIMLAHNEGIWEPAYRDSPFVETYQGSERTAEDAGHWLPEPGVDPRAPTFWEEQTESPVVMVHEDQIDRYGPQFPLSPRDTYRAGIVALDALANQEFESDFVDLNEDQQDSLLEMLEDGEADIFNQPSGEDFFDRVREDTIAGFFSDPAYGGNRDMVGWRLVDYPGAQRAYTPVDMHTESNNREPQSLADLHAFNPGQDANGIIPVRGPRDAHDHD